MATETPTEGTQTQSEQTQLSPETQALAEKGRQGSGTPPEFRPQDQGKPVRPDNVPEKFWDAEKGTVNTEAVLASYSELEKKLGQPKAEPDPDLNEDGTVKDPTPPKEPEGTPDPASEPTAAVTTAVEAAAADYATNNGEMSAEARKGLIDAGIPEAQIDLYIQGVKAQERAIAATAQEAAGGLDVDEIMEWAGKNLNEDEIKLINSGLANPKTLASSMRDLANRYRTSNPSEGNIGNRNGNTNVGDVYTNKAEYLADMAAAEKSGDTNARSKAISKLSRSRKAGTLKEVTPRRGPFGG